MASTRRKVIAIVTVGILIAVGVVVVVVTAKSNQSASFADLADRLIIRPGDLNGGIGWEVEKDLGPPDSLQQNQSSYQYGQFFYQGVYVNEALIVWNTTGGCTNSYHNWQEFADNLTQSGISEKTENISVGDDGYLAKVFVGTWEIVFIRGNVTVSLQFRDYGMGFANNDAKFLYELSTTVAQVQDLKILAYLSSD
ncbi:MAG: hypothetical protein ABR879_06430 [Methanomassiliicoccales archaeon]|jgi:hypothetical protein